jgi:hypothetical protein
VLAQRIGESVEVLDELALDDANTPLACEMFWKRTQEWRGSGSLTLEIYGDASGHQRRTCGTGTDWGLIREFFGQRRGEVTAHLRVAQANPGVRERVSLVNSRLCSAAGERRLFIDPRCKELIRDLERVCWRADATGQPTSELDKSDRMRTHMSDALGYYVAQSFPMRGSVGFRGEGQLI